MSDSPWRTIKQAGERVHRSPRFLAREIKAGRLRAARLGGRGDYILKDAWIDTYVEEQARPLEVVRRRA